jgi:hypothetical protein
MTPQARQKGIWREHPSEAVLVRFMRGELSSREAALIVRHLVAGCARCSAVTQELWSLGDRVPNLKAGIRSCPPSRPLEVWL